MQKVLKSFIACSLALMMMFTMGINVFAAEGIEGTQNDDSVTAAELSQLDEVLAAIGELSNDPCEYTAGDIERVEAIQAAYENLSAEDQETVKTKFGHPSGDGQSYARVLEAALWAVRSFETDTSTTLAPGTYTMTTDPAVSSESSKGLSDSSRVRNWWVESVTVSEDGQATAKLYVTGSTASAKKLTSYPTVWMGGQSYERDSDNNYSIPVDLNGITYFGGVSSSMPRPIMYALTTTIEEPAEGTADLSDAVIAAIPAQTYNGKAKTPAVKVTVGETELVKDTDYTVAYKNNTNAGKATVTVTGIGNYTGEKAAEFTINPAGQTLKVSTAKKTVKFKKLKKKAQTTSKVAVSGAKTKVTYAKVGGSKKLSINKNTGKITVKKKTKKGTYTIKVKVTAAKSANYKAAAKTATIKVKVKK